MPTARDRVAAEIVSLAFSVGSAAVICAIAFPDQRRQAIDLVIARWRRVSGSDARAWRASPPAIFARSRRAELELAEGSLEVTVS